MSTFPTWNLVAFFCSEDPIADSQGVDASDRTVHGLRILVVEDSYLTARMLARTIEGFGGVVVGPAPSVRAALRLLETDGCDAAVLDINLGNETVEPVAEQLLARHLPFFFVSGYNGPQFMNEKFNDLPMLSKPVEPPALVQAIREAIWPTG